MKYDEERRRAALARWDTLAKPLGGMGVFEEMIAQIEGMPAAQGGRRRRVLVFCADNGVVAEGVTQTGSEVTATVAANIARGAASVSLMARAAGADVLAADIGMNAPAEGVEDVCVLRGTADICERPAMTREQCLSCIRTGEELALRSAREGYTMLAVGEMGIGNTTTAAACACALLGLSPEESAGRGAGLSDAGLKRKRECLRRALEGRRPNADDPVDVLAKVGGADIAGMCGAFLGCARAGIAAVIDGFISSVAALCAVRLSPECAPYLLPSHLSGEPAAARVLAALGLHPPLCARMALGEGTGAVALFPLLDLARAVYDGMPTFAEASVTAYKRL